jgi:hypothetical protein
MSSSKRSASDPAVIEDFIAWRNKQLQGIGKKLFGLWKTANALTEAEIASIIQEDIGLLQNINTLDNINKLILRFYADNMKAEDEATRPVGEDGGELKGFGVRGLYRMNASKKNNDCLMHSFLTSTCENFRRLEQNSKDEFANFFRRTVFLTLPAVQCFQANEPDLGQRMAGRVMSTAFLEEQELRLLAAQFRVNILAATGESGRFQPATRETLLHVLPAECVPGGAFEHTIAIFTNGAHFEALRDREGYTFSERKIGDFIRRSENAANARQGAGNNNMARAIAASLNSAKSAKKPALNHKAIANSMGVTVAELKAMYTNANLNAMFSGGGKRRTRRRRA